MIKSTPSLHIEFARSFEQQLRVVSNEIKETFLETLVLFREDPHHPFLRNHPLKEQFAGYRSIDVTDDWRAVFKESSTGDRNVITFHLIGTHKELYG
jgi:addiction module RelE/StbE family toxin